MATQKYLDNTGLAYFWGKIKAWVTGLGYITSSGSITGNAATATKTKGVFLVIPDQTTQNATLTASVAGITEYFPGLMVAYRAPFNTAANTTLNINSLGAKPVYYGVNTTSKDYYPANRLVLLVYETTTASTGCWKMVYSYDGNSNTYDRRLHSNNVKMAAAVAANTIIVGTSAGYKQAASGVAFDLAYPILVATEAKAADATSAKTYDAIPSVNLQTTKASWTGTQYSTVFLVGTLSGTTVTIDSSVFTTTIPSSADGKVYIPIGVLYSTYQVFFAPTKDIYQYTNGRFHLLDTTTAAAGSANGAVKINGTDVTVYTHPTTSGSKHIPSGGSSGQFLKWSADGTAAWAADNNTTYTFASGDSDGQIKVTPSGGTAQNVSVKGLKSAAYTESSAYAAASHGTHVTFPSSGTPANIGTASNGTASTVARSDHVHALPDSGVTANTYGNTSQQTPSHGGTFNIPHFTVDAKGRITAAGTTTVKLPADNNTDTLVTQNVSTANEEHPILLTVTKDANANQGAKTSIFAAAVKVNPSTGTVTATKFSGPLTGNVTGNCSGSSGSCTGNAATATQFSANKSVTLTGDVTGSASSKAGWSIATTLANSGVTAGRYTSVNVDAKGRVTAGNVKHSYTVAKSAAKNWYRIANANVSQTEATNTLHVQFMVTAYNSGQDTGYYERWFVDCEVFGRNAGIRIFGNTAAPFSQARVLYENTIADIDANDRPAIDLYLNYVMSNAATTVVVEELYNSGWTFVADGALSASSVPTGFENVASAVRNNGVDRSTYADYAPYLNRQISNITAAFTLADSYLYRSRTLNCTGTFTITVPSINSGYMWCVIKNKNTASGVITIHPSTTSVLIDGSNADITLQPGEYVCIHSAGANAYSLIADGRWMSKKADKATTLAGYGITDAKIASGVITLGSSTITPLTSSSSLNAAKLTGTASVNTTGTASNVTGTVAIANGGTGHGAQLVESTASDFNSYTESGDYHVGFPSGTANAPVASSDKLDCVLMVRKIGASASVSSASRYTQIAIVQNPTTSNQLRIFARKGFSDSGNWTAWSEVAFAENFCDLSTEQTISGCNKIISGNDKGWRCTSTNGTQEMRFCVGSGGTNRGIWDVKLNKWTLQMNNTDAYLNGQVNSGSDERLKTKIEPMPDELLDAWDEINWNQFKYLAEVESKGEEDAAIHAGIIAQRVVEAFARHGLDAEKYGFIGRDIPEDGSDGFWMVRYLEALALEAAYQRRRADRLEARIAALEEAMNG